jgi:hypothetical protein
MARRILFITAFAVLAPHSLCLRSADAEPYSCTVLYSMAIPSGQNYAPVSGTAGQTAVTSYGYLVGNLIQNPPALLWSANGVMTNLTPGGSGQADNGAVNGTDGIRQVGSIEAPLARAAVWSGTANSLILLPISNGYTYSEATGVSGNQIVGYTNSTAVLWTNTSSNPVILGGSAAYGTDGVHQVGYGNVSQLQGSGPGGLGSVQEAMLWTGTASSAVNLQPSGFTNSQADAVSGNQQVGFGTKMTGVSSSTTHAIVWSGTAASAVDLDPAGFAFSEAKATNGAQQVGFSKVTSTSTTTSAFLWSGSAASAIDLQALLPSTGVWSSSNAFSVDALGNVFGVATGNFNNFSGTFAIEWSPVLIPGDLDQDGSVTVTDVPAMMSALSDLDTYKSARGLTDEQLTELGDLDNSGTFTNADVQALISKLADRAEQVQLTAISEPSSVLMMLCWIAIFNCSFSRSYQRNKFTR